MNLPAIPYRYCWRCGTTATGMLAFGPPCMTCAKKRFREKLPSVLRGALGPLLGRTITVEVRRPVACAVCGRVPCPMEERDRSEVRVFGFQKLRGDLIHCVLCHLPIDLGHYFGFNRSREHGTLGMAHTCCLEIVAWKELHPVH